VTRVAVDLLGGDHAPGVARDGAQEALDADPDLHVVLVGPPQEAGRLARHPRVRVAPARFAIGADVHPVRAVRGGRDATVRVAATEVRDGRADAAVSFGPAAATVAAARFAVGFVPGVTRTPLAVTVPSSRGPVVLLDVAADLDAADLDRGPDAGPDAGADTLVQFAIAGAAFAAVTVGLEEPRVGLLSTGTDARAGDALRRQAFDLLTATALDFVGNVEPSALVAGGVADVVVTDGFTGNVLLKALAATHSLPQTPGVLLGANGVVVTGPRAGGPAVVADAIAVAASAARARLPHSLAAAMADVVRRRRQLAGLA
jgi:glycerol-3-phosphate acyltransferase PlsX